MLTFNTWSEITRYAESNRLTHFCCLLADKTWDGARFTYQTYRVLYLNGRATAMFRGYAA